MIRKCVALKREQALASAGYTLNHQLQGSAHTFIYHAAERTSGGLKLTLFYFLLQKFSLILQITFSHKTILKRQWKPKRTIPPNCHKGKEGTKGYML